MPESIFEIEQLVTPDDAEAVMFELQDLPCVNQADVDIIKRQAWVSHTTMISPEDKPVIKRDELGVMTMSETYQCTGCRLKFTDIDTWRLGEAGQVYVDAASQNLKKSKGP
jgi:hypothetical protein